jgi:hypothetical protein
MLQRKTTSRALLYLCDSMEHLCTDIDKMEKGMVTGHLGADREAEPESLTTLTEAASQSSRAGPASLPGEKSTSVMYEC